MEMQEIIQQLSTVIGAEIIEDKSKKIYRDADFKARLKFKNWPIMIVFGTTTTFSGGGGFTRVSIPHTSTHTSIAAAFTSLDDLEFWISFKQNFGMFSKSSPLGYPELEGRNVNALVNIEDRMKFVTLLQNSKVHELLVKIFDHDDGGFFSPNPERFYVDKADKNTHVLLYEKPAFFTSSWNEDLDLFKNVVDLFKEILVELVEIGSAADGEPDVRKLAKKQYWYKQK